MVEVLIGVAIFVLGFAIGVWERKVDRVKISRQTIKQMLKNEPQSEVLHTPSDEDYDKEQDKEFSRKIR